MTENARFVGSIKSVNGDRFLRRDFWSGFGIELREDVGIASAADVDQMIQTPKGKGDGEHSTILTFA